MNADAVGDVVVKKATNSLGVRNVHINFQIGVMKSRLEGLFPEKGNEGSDKLLSKNLMLDLSFILIVLKCSLSFK